MASITDNNIDYKNENVKSFATYLENLALIFERHDSPRELQLLVRGSLLK